MDNAELITIPFTTEDGTVVEMYVLEETILQNVHYILVASELSEDAEAYILKEENQDEEYSVYVPVEDDTEMAVIAKVFEELMGDIDFEVQES